MLHFTVSAGLVFRIACYQLLELLRYGNLWRTRVCRDGWLRAFCAHCFSRARHSDSLFLAWPRYWPMAEPRRRRFCNVGCAFLRIRLRGVSLARLPDRRGEPTHDGRVHSMVHTKLPSQDLTSR